MLSTSGHIAAMVNPPGNPKASYQTAPENPADAAGVAGRRPRKVRGSWWDDYVGWLADAAARSGTSRAGSARPRYEPLCDAPGTYVLDRDAGDRRRDRLRTSAVRGRTRPRRVRPGRGRFARRAAAAAVQRHRRRPRGAPAASSTRSTPTAA